MSDVHSTMIIRTPEISAGTTSVTLSEWVVELGDHVLPESTIAILETDKAVVEIMAEREGFIAELLVAPGESIGVGAPLARLSPSPLATTALQPPSQSESSSPARTRPAVETSPSGLAPPTGGNADELARQFISPLARKVAQAARIDVSSISGSGPRGRIMRRDVDAWIAAREDPSSPPASAETNLGTASENEHTKITHNRSRRAIAHRVSRSKSEVPHFYLRRTARLDRLVALKDEVRRTFVDDPPISINDFIVRACARSLLEVPEANVLWADEALLSFSKAAIGIAIASERGLITPVLSPDHLEDVRTISAVIRQFKADADHGRITQSALEGGTMSVSNLGMYGVDAFAAIINPPQSMILAVGAAQERPIINDGEVAIGITCDLTLSVDHRAIDGAAASTWLNAVIRNLEDPLRLVI